MWKRNLKIASWCLLGFASIVLLVAAIQVKNGKTCSGVQIDMQGFDEKSFVDEKDVQKVLTDNKVAKDVPVESVHLGLLESELEKNAWVKNAQLFFDNNQLLTVRVDERQPLARVFTLQGNSFYIDSSASMLPLSDKYSARVPVFTSFPSDKKLIAADSATLQDVKHIAQYIQQDTFWAAQVAQVDITPEHTYEIIPVLGNQVIELGDAQELDKKFNKLFAFYKQVWGKTGFEKYEKIDLEFEGQVVAVKRGYVLAPPDSTLAMQQLANGANMAAAMRDSLYAGNEQKELPPAKDSVSHAAVIASGKTAAGTPKRNNRPKPPVKPGNKKRAGHKPAKRN